MGISNGIYHSLCLLGKCGDDIMDEIISDLCGLVRNLIVVISVDSRFCSLKSSFITLAPFGGDDDAVYYEI